MAIDIKQEVVERHIGETLTGREIKALFGYSKNTLLKDTALFDRGWLRLVRNKLGQKGAFLYEIVKGQPLPPAPFRRQVESGKKCPKCGALGKDGGDHETKVRTYQGPLVNINDVGWKCWNCGYEWGFESPGF